MDEENMDFSEENDEQIEVQFQSETGKLLSKHFKADLISYFYRK